jgi:hypothetical protein
VPKIDLRRVMRDELDPLLAQERLEVRLGQVGLDEARAVGNRIAAACREVVDDDQAMPVGQMAARHVRADEAGAASDEDVHRGR